MASLAAGAFITSINGKRCTAVPKSGASTATSTNTETKGTTTSTSTTENADRSTAALSTTTTSQDESSTSTGTTISTSLILTTSTSITSDVPPQQTQTSVQVAPAAPEPAPTPESSPATTSTIPTFTQITTSESQPQPAQATSSSSAIIKSSQTDTVDTALATQTTPDTASSPTSSTTSDTTSGNAAASVQHGTALPDVTSSPVPADSTAALFTAVGAARGSPQSAAAAEATGSSSATAGAVGAISVPSNSGTIRSTVAVAGGVIGGVALIGMVAFFGWWWRRRYAKRRRSTMLTPLTIDNALDEPGERDGGGYVINRGSIGPTPRAEKLKAALGYNMRKMKGSISRGIAARRQRRTGSTTPSVNVNRGKPQVTEPATTSSDPRPGSSAATTGSDGADATAKDGLMDWWTRLAEAMSFNWRLKSAKNPDSDDLLGSPRGMNEKKAGGNARGSRSTPDFLALLGMDDRELDREAQRRGMSASRQNGGSAASSDRLLGGLNLNFGSDDPFGDFNAVTAKPAPVLVGQSSSNNNPFSDANVAPSSSAAKTAGTYVAEIRRSRGQSASTAAGTVGPWRPPVIGTAGGYRESGASVSSFATRRNKFRSDPFDLERPELLGRRPVGGSASSSGGATVGSSSNSSSSRASGGGVAAGDGVRRPAGAHTKTDSFTSKYSSGIGMGDWSDPGPDVGPAAAARGGGEWHGPEQRESPTQGWRTRLEREESAARRERRTSGGSQETVGKAI